MGSVHFFNVITGDGADMCQFVSSKKGVVNEIFFSKDIHPFCVLIIHM